MSLGVHFGSEVTSCRVVQACMYLYKTNQYVTNIENLIAMGVAILVAINQHEY
jgi:hypothetical protein